MYRWRQAVCIGPSSPQPALDRPGRSGAEALEEESFNLRQRLALFSQVVLAERVAYLQQGGDSFTTNKPRMIFVRRAKASQDG